MIPNQIFDFVWFNKADSDILSMVKTLSSQAFRTGQTAPSFNLKGVDGKTYSFDDFDSRSVLVIFICNHCPYVKARIGDLIELQRKFSGQEFRIVGINSNDPDYPDEGFDNMVKFSESYNLNFPYLIDDTQSIARQYGAVCTPDPFLLDNQKRLVFHGRINDAMEPGALPKIPVMENNVRKILEGKALDNDFDPSVGCSIKWKD
jgi:peroxiredoxin